MVNKTLVAAGVLAAAVLGVLAVDRVVRGGPPGGGALTERGPYANDYAVPPRLWPQRAPDIEPTRRQAAAHRALGRVHDDILDDDPPGEESWLPVSVGDARSPYPVWHAVVLPGATIKLSADADFALSLDGEILTDISGAHWWTAPDEPGVHTMRAFTAGGDQQYLSVFVLTPRSNETYLEGYRIGTYPQDPPDGFIRLTAADMDTPVSPSFKIGQFICKQQIDHWPKFLVVTGDLLVRLEVLLAGLREDDRTDADTFFVMSGYRTPFYNTAIGSARLSRHMYGDAADIYPDVEGGDSVIDDLNQDGRITRADAEWLYDYADHLFTASDAVVAGGIGAYGANAAHGPFVHVDGRGRAARWGRYGS